MALVPLFTSLDDMRTRLRMSSTDADSDAEVIFGAAVQWARVYLYRAVGIDRCTTIAATTTEESPDDMAAAIKGLAIETEAMLVRAKLMEQLPVSFMDGGQSPTQMWNDEAPFRVGNYGELRRARTELMREIERNIASLRSGTLEAKRMRVVALEPTDPVERRGSLDL